jgi:hydroxylaminobenzene mutase
MAAIWQVGCSQMREATRSSLLWDKNMKANDRRLMWHGMFLFLLGLITGLVEQRFTNIRMGLSAHLEGVMNGIFLVALGAIWNRVRLPRHVMMAAYGMALYGTYANWLTTLL